MNHNDHIDTQSYSDENKIIVDFYIKRMLTTMYDDEKSALEINIKISHIIIAVVTKIISMLAIQSKEKDDDSIKTQLALVQYMACKHLAVHDYVSNKRTLTINGVKYEIKDATAAICIIRSMYETLLLHNSLFVNPQNQDEQNLLINIWKLKSENSFITLESDEIEMKNIKCVVRELRERLKNNRLYDKYSKEIENCIKSKTNIGYFKGEEKTRGFNQSSITDSWHLLKISKECKNNNLDKLYKKLCSETHVSYSAILAFEQQSTRKPDIKIYSLYCSCVFVCMILNEVLKTNDWIKSNIQLSDEEQTVFNAFIDIL